MYSVPYFTIQYRQELVAYFYYCGILFWASLVTAISGLSSINALQKIFPFLSLLSPTLLALISGFLPALILVAIMGNLPSLLHWIAVDFIGIKTRSAVKKHVLEW